METRGGILPIDTGVAKPPEVTAPTDTGTFTSECSTEMYAQSDESAHWVGEMVSRCSVQKFVHHSPHTLPFFPSQVIFAKELLPGR
jgi:hypothetical protein